MMFTTAIKIYLVANLVFLIGISLYMLPEGFMFALFAAPFALIFTAPLILLLTIVLWLLHMSRIPPVLCWVLFLLSMAAMTYVPIYWQGSDFNTGNIWVIIVWSYIGAFTSVLALHKEIHRFFQRKHPVKSNMKREPWTI